ncbi:MAG: hypothetical protein JWQ40_2143 [Segetibacter sp.]|nr:hypothetical protein [Segetibacter sp.]
MKKVIVQCFAGAIFFTLLTSCGKDVKAPEVVFASSAKTTSSPPTSTTASSSTQQSQDQSSQGCGSRSMPESNGGY